MSRHKYIRFFISSTFADMNIERNVLQELMAELEAEYQKQGWQIEYVDLRWGITNEAGLDNRTMRICLAELNRCKQLSPKPNFIILAGQRRGWIPLPEELSISEMKYMEQKVDSSKRELLKEWYKLDTNYSSKPMFVLQPRRGRYSDYDTWANEVYEPLSSLLDRTAPSATELEIIRGALQESDAHEHVVAYLRNLSKVPCNKQILNVQFSVKLNGHY